MSIDEARLRQELKESRTLAESRLQELLAAKESLRVALERRLDYKVTLLDGSDFTLEHGKVLDIGVCNQTCMTLVLVDDVKVEAKVPIAERFWLRRWFEAQAGWARLARHKAEAQAANSSAEAGWEQVRALASVIADIRKAVDAQPGEDVLVAVKRVVREEARLRSELEQVVDQHVKLCNELRTTLGSRIGESVRETAKRVMRDADALRADWKRARTDLERVRGTSASSPLTPYPSLFEEHLRRTFQQARQRELDAVYNSLSLSALIPKVKLQVKLPSGFRFDDVHGALSQRFEDMVDAAGRAAGFGPTAGVTTMRAAVDIKAGQMVTAAMVESKLERDPYHTRVGLYAHKPVVFAHQRTLRAQPPALGTVSDPETFTLPVAQLNGRGHIITLHRTAIAELTTAFRRGNGAVAKVTVVFGSGSGAGERVFGATSAEIERLVEWYRRPYTTQRTAAQAPAPVSTTAPTLRYVVSRAEDIGPGEVAVRWFYSKQHADNFAAYCRTMTPEAAVREVRAQRELLGRRAPGTAVRCDGQVWCVVDTRPEAEVKVEHAGPAPGTRFQVRYDSHAADQLRADLARGRLAAVAWFRDERAAKRECESLNRGITEPLGYSRVRYPQDSIVIVDTTPSRTPAGK